MNPTQKPQIPEVIKGLNAVIKSHQNQIAVWASLEEAVRMAGGASKEVVDKYTPVLGPFVSDVMAHNGLGFCVLRPADETKAPTIDVKTALDVLRATMRADDMLAWGWNCNIASAAMDEGIDHTRANRAARRFMELCFGVTPKEPVKGSY